MVNDHVTSCFRWAEVSVRGESVDDESRSLAVMGIHLVLFSGHGSSGAWWKERTWKSPERNEPSRSSRTIRCPSMITRMSPARFV